MIEVDADATRSRRRTWVTGGALLIAAALLGLGAVSAPGLPFGIAQLLFHAGAVVFAVGLGRGGSVTARRPLGTAAIIALAAWTLLVTPVAWMLVNEALPFDAADGAYMSTVRMIGMTDQVVTLVLAIIAVMQIGRIAVVPKPWNWAPLWALGAIVVAQLMPNLLAAATRIGDQTVLGALFSLIPLVTAAAVAFLGVIAIALAARTTEKVVFASPR